jgi:hypothetical protein
MSEQLRGALIDCHNGSIWRRNADGAIVEVQSTMFWSGPRGSGEKVTTGPVQLEGIKQSWERYLNRGPRPGHRTIVYQTFMRTHTRLSREEQDWHRHAPVQLELPLRKTIVPYLDFSD